jgi:hypothetical protein
MTRLDGYDKADMIAIMGMVASAATEYTEYIPQNYELLGVGGIGLAAVAIAGKLYVKHKSILVSKIDKIRHKIFKSEHKDGDEEAIEDVVDAAAEIIEDVVTDILDDGELNNSNE